MNLDPSGDSCSAESPNRTLFTIWHKIGNSTTWTLLDSVAAKKCIDSSVPGGTSTVTYFVRAQRNNQVRPPATRRS